LIIRAVASGVLDFNSRVGNVMQPALRIRIKTTPQEPPDAAWHRGRQLVPIGMTFEDSVDCFGNRAAAERAPSSEHFVQEASERPDVRALIDRLAARLLGTHVCGCPGDEPFPNDSGGLAAYVFLGADRPRQSEIEDLH
jgi:hypothetical protein